VQTDILFCVVGTCCVGALGCGKALGWYGEGVEVGDSRRALLVGLYLLRTFGVNATGSLQYAVLMDYCKKSQRARWSALESVTSLGWSGSAALGGLIIERFGYDRVFLCTAVLHALAIAVRLPLLLIVPKNEAALLAEDEGEDEEGGAGEGERGAGLTSPLLGAIN